MGDKTNVFRDAYDTNTGQKLPNKIPEAHFGIFKDIRKTPKQRATETRPNSVATPETAPAATEQKEK